MRPASTAAWSENLSQSSVPCLRPSCFAQVRSVSSSRGGGHEHVGLDPPARLGARLTQRLDEPPAIHFVLEDRLAAVAAIHRMVNCPRILDSPFARHDGRVAATALCVMIKN